VAAALDRVIVERDVDVVFIPFGYGHDVGRFWDDDIRIARQLRARLTQKARFQIIEGEYHPEAILGLFQLFDAFLGVRFHSIVFAEVVGVPTVALVYDTKVEAFVAQRPWIDALWFDACSDEAIFNRLSRKIREAREQRNRPVRGSR
jgi:polysaccharide pyruvyl transferase WcaK-like protein